MVAIAPRTSRGRSENATTRLSPEIKNRLANSEKNYADCSRLLNVIYRKPDKCETHPDGVIRVCPVHTRFMPSRLLINATRTRCRLCVVNSCLA